MYVTCAARSDVGLIRSGNEDSHLVSPDHGLFIVADGMGGHAAGEVASGMAVERIRDALGSLKGASPESVMERLLAAIRGANEAIYQRTLTEREKRGMGTTATVLVLIPDRYVVAHVGDSRAYLLRGGVLHQLTKDHSYVQEQVDEGRLTPEQARTHPYSNVITRCLGASWQLDPDVFAGAVEAGDLFLLTSDGLTGMIEDETLAAILQTDGTPERWVDRMVVEANRRGGLDNITAIVVRVESVGASAEAPLVAETPAESQ